MTIQALVDGILTKQEGELFIQALEERLDGSKRNNSYEKLPLYLSEKLVKLEKEMDLTVVYDKFRLAFFKKTFVGFTIAFEPTENFLKDVVDWISENLMSRVILDLQVDEDVIGGAKIFCSDHYRDYSIASKLEGDIPEKTLELGQISTLI